MGPTAVRVFVVDDHLVVREGLSRMLSSCGEVEIVGSAASGEEALRLVPRVSPDVVLLDLSLPRMQGLEVLAELRKFERPPHVVVLTVHDDQDLVLGAARLGADGYVLKQTSRDELTKAIRVVAAGGQYFCPAVVALLGSTVRAQAGTARLAERELQVLRLVAAGAENREIAGLLHVSTETVKTHLAHVYRKLNVTGRAHAVAVAIRQGLLE